VPKAVYRSGCRDKHKRPRRDSNLQYLWVLCSQTRAANHLPLRPASKKGKDSPYSITERRVPQLIPVLGSQPAADVNHKPDDRASRLPLVKRAATNFAAW